MDQPSHWKESDPSSNPISIPASSSQAAEDSSVKAASVKPLDLSQAKDQAAPIWPFTIPLSVDEGEDAYLSTSVQTNTAEEELFPREVIASAVGSTNLQVELKRPIRVGTFNDLPACLLCVHLSFQKVGTGSFHRIQAAHVTIVFEDAASVSSVGARKGAKKATAASKAVHPAIAAWYPQLFEGEISTEFVSNHVEGTLKMNYMGVGADVKVGQNKHSVSTSRITVHGVLGGGGNRNAITWSIEEDHIARSGIPREVLLPLVVTHRAQRFRARVTIKAHFGFWRGTLARSVPVLGRNDEPLFFDPKTLTDMAETKSAKGPDGKLIAEESGNLNELDLCAESSFKGKEKQSGEKS